MRIALDNIRQGLVVPPAVPPQSASRRPMLRQMWSWLCTGGITSRSSPETKKTMHVAVWPKRDEPQSVTRGHAWTHQLGGIHGGQHKRMPDTLSKFNLVLGAKTGRITTTCVTFPKAMSSAGCQLESKLSNPSEKMAFAAPNQRRKPPQNRQVNTVGASSERGFSQLSKA